MGVYLYAYQLWILFKTNDGYVSLELRMNGCLTKAKGGSPGRYLRIGAIIR